MNGVYCFGKSSGKLYEVERFAISVVSFRQVMPRVSSKKQNMIIVDLG